MILRVLRVFVFDRVASAHIVVHIVFTSQQIGKHILWVAGVYSSDRCTTIIVSYKSAAITRMFTDMKLPVVLSVNSLTSFSLNSIAPGLHCSWTPLLLDSIAPGHG